MSFRTRTLRRLGGVALVAGAAVGAVPVAAYAAPASDTVLVRVDADATRTERAEVARLLDAEAVTSLPGGWREYHVPDPVTAVEARSDLREADAAEMVVLPQRMRPLTLPDDPYLQGGQQWGLHNTGGTGGTPGIDIDAEPGWGRAVRRDPVVVAVVDTGVQVAHPDLAGRVWSNADETPGNGIDDDGNGYVDDTAGWDFAEGNASVYDNGTDDRHGTHVAGIVAALPGNGTGIAGVAPNAVVMPLKFIGAGGTGWNSDAVRAIQYAVNNGARVINGSFGGGTYDPALCDAIAWAAQRGVTFVAAAGNNGQDLDAAGTWPARCTEPTMLTVVAVTSTGGLASFSSRSPVHTDVGAPGQTVLSTVPNGYAYMSGTSMAAPHVSGLVAAIHGESPGLTPADVRKVVVDGGTPLASLAGTTSTGRMVSLDGSLAQAVGGDYTAPQPFELAGPAPGALTTQRRPTFTWAPATDTGGGVTGYRLLVDGIEVASTTGATTATPGVDLEDGSHSWTVEALDAAGNARRATSRTVTVDATAPAGLTVLTPAEGGTLGERVTVVWTPASDPASGVARYEVLVDGAVVATAPGGSTAAAIGARAGTRSLVVRATDAAGNVAVTPPRRFTIQAAAIPRPRVSVTPRPTRLGRRTVVRVRASRLARVTLVAGNARGRRVGRLVRVVPKGASVVVLPSTLARRIGPRGRVGLGTVEAAVPAAARR